LKDKEIGRSHWPAIALETDRREYQNRISFPDQSCSGNQGTLRQTIRNFGQELQSNLDNPPRNGLEMAQRMRELAARMSAYGIPQMFRG
jgi:hypothetical protein